MYHYYDPAQSVVILEYAIRAKRQVVRTGAPYLNQLVSGNNHQGARDSALARLPGPACGVLGIWHRALHPAPAPS